MKIIIPTNGLMTLNQYTNANRGNKFGGAKKKKEATQICALHTKKAMREGFKINSLPVNLQFDWYAKDRRTDPDNLAFMQKFILDGMQKAEAIPGDGWGEIKSLKHNFFIDKDNPRVEITQKQLN